MCTVSQSVLMKESIRSRTVRRHTFFPQLFTKGCVTSGCGGAITVKMLSKLQYYGTFPHGKLYLGVKKGVARDSYNGVQAK